VNPRAADAVRKACAYGLAIALTVLTFRVLARAADGRGSLADAELWTALALLTLGVLWVRAARRVGRPRQ
jgi:hypothetical protein